MRRAYQIFENLFEHILNSGNTYLNKNSFQTDEFVFSSYYLGKRILNDVIKRRIL